MQKKALLMALALAAPVAAEAASVPNETAWASGTNWSYETRFLGFPAAWVYTPSSFSTRVPNRRGLVFHLMGCGQTPFQVAQASGWPDAAEAYGLVIVVPATVNPANPNNDAPQVECLNYGYDGAYGVRNPTRTDADHAAIIDAAQRLGTDPQYANYAIDPNQVYVAGLSAGGAVSTQVACMAPDVFAGFATAAAPGLGTSQGTAVLPPPAGFNKDSVKRLCQQWANGSSNPGALADMVVAIVSDDNGLPAGNGPLDISKFNNQRIWDGDKFCPHIYGATRAQAFAELLNVTASGTAVPLGTGQGIGCAGGERSRGDTGEVECVINDFVTRNWTALADTFVDANGATRLVRIQQDTLRHSWPSGPIGMRDFEATPTRTDLRGAGFIDTSTGEFDRSRMGNAPNGQYGTIYFNHQSLDFPMFLAELWTNNNPRLGPPAGTDRAPELVDLAITPSEVNGTYSVLVTGRAQDPDPDDVLQSAAVVLRSGGAEVDRVDLPGNGTPAITLNAAFAGLAAGAYEVVFVLTPMDGAAVEITRTVTLGGPANLPPTVQIASAAPTGADCLTVAGTATDDDGAVARVEVTVFGLGPAAATVTDGAFTYERCGLTPGDYRVVAQAFDELDAGSAETGEQTVEIRGANLESARGTLTEHIDAGRVTRFSQAWSDYRDAYCTQTPFFTWECDPFDLYRCEGDAAWTDVQPQCGGGEVGTVSLGVALALSAPTVEVGQPVTLTVSLDNAGPDAAAAVHAILPRAGLAADFGSADCVVGEVAVRCHLDGLEAGGSVQAQVTLTPTSPGTLTLSFEAASAQSVAPFKTAVGALEVSAPPPPPDAGTGGNPGRPDAGTGGNSGRPDAGASNPPPGAVDAGVEDDRPDSGVWNGAGSNGGCRGSSSPVSLLALVGLGLVFVRRRR